MEPSEESNKIADEATELFSKLSTEAQDALIDLIESLLSAR